MHKKCHFLIDFTDIFTSDKWISSCLDGIACVVILTDDHVGHLYAEKLSNHLTSHRIKTHTLKIAPGESSKTRAVNSDIEDQMFSLGCGRDTLMIALGGGVITDLAGFIAATYCRGIPAIYMPTSLLAMADACIGGKTGINTPFGKNTIGTFTQPKAICIDIHLLDTLSEHAYLGGLSEAIKHALIDDSTHFKWIALHWKQLIRRDKTHLTTLIQKSCDIKANIVSDDEKETGKREMLNFGHTIGHALEHASGYSMTHGHAVAWGMIAEAYMAKQSGHLTPEDFEILQHLIQKILRPLGPTIDVSANAIINALTLDKKNRKQTNRFVLLNGIGAVVQACGAYAHVVDPSIVAEAIHYIRHLDMSDPK